MQSLVGALVDAVGLPLGGVALAEGDHRPSEAPIGVLHQTKDETERCRRSPLGIKRHVELGAAREFRPVGAFGLTEFPIEASFPRFDFPSRPLRLEASLRARAKPFDLLLPLGLSELDRGFGQRAALLTFTPRRQKGSPPSAAQSPQRSRASSRAARLARKRG